MIGFLRLPEAAATVGCSVKTLRRALRDPDAPLPFHRIGKRLLVISETDLARWMAVRRLVGVPADTDAEVAAFLGGFLQPKCNRPRATQEKPAIAGADPLIDSQPTSAR